MLLFAGCSSGSSGGSSSGGNYNPSAIYSGGSEGLTIEFTNNAPPEKIRDQASQEFAIRMIVKNMGEYDIPENGAHVVLDGFDFNAFGVTQISKPLREIRGYSKKGDSVVPGGQDQVSFDKLRYQESVGGGVLPLTLGAKVCYPYQTKATTLLCINGDTLPSYDDEEDRVCELDGVKISGNSGGPFTIENVEQFTDGPSRIRFQFDIVHNPKSASSKVYELSALNTDCKFGNEQESQKNRVRYTVETGLPGLKCGESDSGTNTETLYDDRTTVYCTQDTTGQNEFEKPTFITLDYAYVDKISTSINIEHQDIN